MNVLSLFDGIAGGKLALNNLGVDCTYFASEINKYAIDLVSKRFPDIIQLGDVKGIDGKNLPPIDLLIGGSPCQSLSIARHQKSSGLYTGQSVLFWEYLRLLEYIKPTYFLLENVSSMKKTDKNIITNRLKVEPYSINSAIFTAQQRKRYYWTNIPLPPLPMDKGIVVNDILTDNGDKYKIKIKHNKIKWVTPHQDCSKPIRIGTIGNGGTGQRIYSTHGKCPALLSGNSRAGVFVVGDLIRKLSPIEWERLQGLPDDYTFGYSDTLRYKMIGNGFTIPVIIHILEGIFNGKLYDNDDHYTQRS